MSRKYIIVFKTGTSKKITVNIRQMEKYLQQYAEPEASALVGLPDLEAWMNVVVIPACNEDSRCLRSPPLCGGRSLMILVINESQSASSSVSSNNRALALAVAEKFVLQWQTTAATEQGFGLKLFRDEVAKRDVLLVDRFSEGRTLPVKGGVGQARKIGVDLATSLIHRGRIKSPWIHCTDGDVRLPETYFSSSNQLQNQGAEYSTLIYPFFHCNDQASAEQNEIELATQLYELSLRYYVAGMKLAGSPYAFHTIGSTMAVRANHYAKVRGFPRRAAGEDFYLLNKLAKVGLVMELHSGPECLPLEIESRRSERVPFGTGAAVNKITALTEPVGEFRFYDPMVFELLGYWLSTWPAIWDSRSTDFSATVLAIQPVTDKQRDGLRLLVSGLGEIGVKRALDHAFRQSKSLDQFTKQMHTWFDAFRTLKLIHFLRDQDLVSVSYAELLSRQGFQRLLDQDADLRDFHNRLKDSIQAIQMQSEPGSVSTV